MSASFSGGQKLRKRQTVAVAIVFITCLDPCNAVQVLEARDSSQQRVHVQSGEKPTDQQHSPPVSCPLSEVWGADQGLPTG